MTHRVRNAFGRFLASGYAAAVALLVAASSLAAQQTSGKIEGTVTDQQGGPIANAQVSIVGTSFGALTNEKGYYFINNVPVGTYTVRGRFIGFTAAEVPGVRVQGGFTQTVNIKLTPSAVAIGPVVVEAAANPIVPRDKVTSGSTVSGDLVAHLPVDDVRQILTFQPGVVESGSTAGVSIRGGRPGEANVYIDAGFDAVVPDTAADGNVTQTILPRFVQYSGNCGQLGSGGSPMAQAIQSNYGFDCQGRRLAMNWTTRIQLQGNLQYTYGSGSSIRFTGVANGTQQRFNPGRNLADPALFQGQHTWQRLGVLNWNHQLTRSAERALSVNLNLSWGRDRSIQGPLDPTTDIETRDPKLGLEFGTPKFAGFGGFPFPITDQIIRNIRTNNPAGLRVPLLNRADLTNSQTGRLNPYGLQAGSFFTSGMDVTGTLLSETRYIGRLVVDWQANRYHRFTLGGDAKKTDLAYWSSGMLRQIFMDAYVVHPVQYGLFASDRLDLGDVVLELGLRWDYFNPKALFSNTPGFIFGDPGWSADAATNDAAYTSSLARVFTPSVGHRALSPRLRVSFPVTEKTGFRLSYSHQVQTPEFTTLLSGSNNDLFFTNTNDTFGP